MSWRRFLAKPAAAREQVMPARVPKAKEMRANANNRAPAFKISGIWAPPLMASMS